MLSFELEQCLHPFAMLSVEEAPETRLFSHISKVVFPSPKIRKNISNEGHPFLENVKNLIKILKMQKKIEKKFFVFEIIASELIALNCLYMGDNACYRQSMR